MNQTIESKNKALALEAFDTLFNKRDYTAAECYWSSNYIHHSSHLPPGRDGLFNLIKNSPPTLKYEQSPGVRRPAAAGPGYSRRDNSTEKRETMASGR